MFPDKGTDDARVRQIVQEGHLVARHVGEEAVQQDVAGPFDGTRLQIVEQHAAQLFLRPLLEHTQDGTDKHLLLLFEVGKQIRLDRRGIDRCFDDEII